MSQEMEYESKNLLTKKEYDILCEHLNHTKIKPKNQINYYFETENFALKDKGAALRIREKNGHHVLTLKQPHQEGLLETHEMISSETLRLWLNNQTTPVPKVERQLNELNVKREELKYGGKLKTKRIEVNYLNTVIVLDKSNYNNRIDYELEVEANSKEQANQVLAELLKTYHISKKNTPNKIARFYQSLES
ncbi:CYTH domain-containing protein [Amphibacillus sp. Q70]|uniref:CYTH domain-containing protein n=1 Tax=Amphibacillus sp. Q70 TaxID=3453416 RepID=UPI003F873096